MYQVQEAEEIASGLRGKPVYIHADEAGLHYNDDKHLIGKVVNTTIDTVNKVIKGIVEIWNNSKYPNLLSRIKEGWGFSIGGVLEKIIPTGKFNDRLKPIVHAIGMRANHLQLLEPQEKRGDPAAMVDGMIPVMESLQIDPEPDLITADDMTGGIDSTEITSDHITPTKRMRRTEIYINDLRNV